MDQEVKVKITADSTEAVSGFQRFSNSIKTVNNETASVVKSIQAHWLGVSVAIGAAAVAATKAWGMLKTGAEFSEQAGILNNLARKYSSTADDIVKSMQRASSGMIANTDLMKIALGGLAKGLNPDQLIKLSDAAKILSDTVGGSATQALDDLTQALESGRVRGLKAYGGATIELKDAFGDLEAKMTAAEKAQAMYSMIMIHATKLQKEQTIAVDETADKIEKMEAKWKNLTTTVSVSMKQLVVSSADYIERHIIEPQNTLSALFQRIHDQGFKKGFLETPIYGQTGPGVVEVPPLGSAKTADPEAVYKKEMDALKKILQARNDAEDKAKRAPADAAAKERALDEYYKHEKEVLVAIGKAEEDLTKAAVDGTKASIDSLKKMGEEAERTRLQNVRIQAQFYEESDPFGENAHKARLAQIAEYAAIFRAAKIEEVDIERWAAEERGRLEQELFERKTQYISAGFGQLADAFAGIGALYEQGSKDAQMWQAASDAMLIAQKAVAVVNAVAAIANQGLGDPYTAFVRIAAMAAAMGALLATIGTSISGGGSGAAAAQGPAMGNSTVLGAAYGTASESLSKSFELLQDTYDLEDTKLTKIYTELRDLNHNITGIVSGIIRTGNLENLTDIEFTVGENRKASNSTIGMASAAGFMSNPLTGLIIASTGLINKNMTYEQQGQLMSKIIGFWSGDPFTAIIHTILDKIFDKKLGTNIGKFLGGIFGGKTTIGTIGGGIKIGGASIQDIMSGGVLAQQYQTIMMKTSGGWFGKDKVGVMTKYSEVDAEVANLFNKVFQNLGGTLVGLAELLGTDISAALGYQFKDIKLNLMGKDGEGISKAISEALSAAGDNAAKALFGELISRYQQVNEGLLETATRLVLDKESVMNILQYTNQAFDGTTSELLTFSEALIDVAGSLEDLTEAFQTYYDAFFSDAEKQADLKRQLSGALGSYGYSLPGTRAGYRALVEGVNLADDAGKAAYAALMMLADSADAYYDYLEDAKSKINESDYSTRVEYERAVRGYAGGGYHSGGYRIVGEYGPELERTGPSTIYSTSDSRKALGTDDLIASVEKLRAEVGEANFSIASTQLKLAKLLDKWDGEGMPAERT